MKSWNDLVLAITIILASFAVGLGVTFFAYNLL